MESTEILLNNFSIPSREITADSRNNNNSSLSA